MEANRLRQLFPTSLSTSASLRPILPSISTLNSSLPYHSSTAASDCIRCYSRRPDVRKPNWDDTGTERSKFYPYTELYGNDEDEEEGDGGFLEFGQSKKYKKWRSDDDEEEEEDGEEDEFWGFKVLRVFGWMVPAILISMVLGNGPNALFMAVALPLGQTALSLAVDKVCEMATQPSRPKPRNRPRGKPFASSSNTNRARKRKQDADFVGSNGTASSPSNTKYHEPVQGNGHRASTSFGGWDE